MRPKPWRKSLPSSAQAASRCPGCLPARTPGHGRLTREMAKHRWWKWLVHPDPESLSAMALLLRGALIARFLMLLGGRASMRRSGMRIALRPRLILRMRLVRPRGIRAARRAILAPPVAGWSESARLCVIPVRASIPPLRWRSERSESVIIRPVPVVRVHRTRGSACFLGRNSRSVVLAAGRPCRDD